MNGRRATGPLFIRKVTKWTQLLSTQVTSFIEPYFSKTDNDSISKDWTEFRWKDIARSSFHWYVQKIRFTSFTIIDCQIKSIWPLLYGMYSKMISIIWWKNVYYSRTPTTINCHMLPRRLKRLSQFWTKKGTKFPSGMTKIFWKVTFPNIKP